MSKNNFVDFTGQHLNNVTVIKQIGLTKNWNAIWECKCVCGKIIQAIIRQLKNPKYSCGCQRSHPMQTHGLSHTVEYAVYKTMLSRCYNINNKKFCDYGGRGIEVCERWKGNFNNFIKDMGFRPSPKHSIEREDNYGNYSPENCSWQLSIVQNRNKRNTKITMELAREIRKLELPQRKIAEIYGVTQTTIGYIKSNKQWKEI